jgi:hypothetical protein
MLYRRHVSHLALVLCVLASSAAAQDPGSETTPPGPGVTDSSDDAPIFGRDLMTPEERAAHRSSMRAARSAEERETLRAAHHRRMVERAKERGVTLPETPPPRGVGAGAKPGAGSPRGR